MGNLKTSYNHIKYLWSSIYHKNASLKLFGSVLNTPLEVAAFSLKILFWLPKLYHLIFLFSVKRQKPAPGLLYKKSCSWEFCKTYRKTLVSEFLFQWSCRPEVCNFIKKKTSTKIFPVNSAKSKNSSLEEHLRTSACKKIYNYSSITGKNILPNFF